MPMILILTADSFLEAAMRLECLAEGIACRADGDLKGVDAAVVDLEGISPGRLSIARKLARDGVPTIFIKEDPAATPETSTHPCILKPVEATRLIYLVRKMVDRAAARSGHHNCPAPASYLESHQLHGK